MVEIYTSIDMVDINYVIIDNESFFNNSISAKELSHKSLDVMNRIDRAVLIDSNLGTIRTPYGVTSIKNLSTGCKTVLNYIYILENRESVPELNDVKAISANECGWNALEELFKVADSMCGIDNISSVGIVLEHENGICMCSDRDYLIDGDRIVHSLYFI